MTFFAFCGIPALITIFLLPRIKAIALNFGFTDHPSPRKQHKKPLVRFGGVAMAISFYSTLIVLLIVFKSNLIKYEGTEIIWVLVGTSLCFFLIGLTDDIFQLSPWPRLGLQMAIACFAWSKGLSINTINIPWANGTYDSISLSIPISILITIFWIVGITNAINWLDGLDGLAAGIVAISALEISIISASNNNIGASIAAIVLAGCCIGLLRYNYHPASVLMGDGGSYFLGYNLAALSIIGCSDIVNTGGIYNIFDFHLVVIILLLPIIDMLFVIISRILEKKSPFYPDRRHIHHRLLKMGLDHPRTVLLLQSITLWLGSISLMLARINLSFYWFMTLSIIILIMFLAFMKSLKDVDRRNNQYL